MAIKYRELMKEYDVTLENKDEVLDAAFVSKATEFEQKVVNNELTDDEIKAWDDELVELFNKHNLSEEDSEDVKNLKKAKEISDAKAEIAETETFEDLNKLQVKFKDLPEVLPLIAKKLDIIEKAVNKTQEDNKAKFLTDAKAEIAAAAYDQLQAMGEKYKDHPELIEIVNKRHKEEKPGNDDAELAAKLRSKKEWSYAALRELGINPTGDDMTVAGVKLEKEYLLAVYSVRK